MKILDNLKSLPSLGSLDDTTPRRNTNTQSNEQFQQVNNNIFQKINTDNSKPVIIKKINNIWEVFR